MTKRRQRQQQRQRQKQRQRQRQSRTYPGLCSTQVRQNQKPASRPCSSEYLITLCKVWKMAQEGFRGLPAQKILAPSWNVVNMGQWKTLKSGLLSPRGELQLQGFWGKAELLFLTLVILQGVGERKKGAKCAVWLCFTGAREQGKCSPACLVNPDGVLARSKNPYSSGSENMCWAKYVWGD